ncbi:caspase domain-containing protein [Mycena vulgaris]|nr:caspase domain-containing protein [Mycena vulgaris]
MIMVVNRGPAAAGSVLDVQFPAQESSSRASTVTLNDSDTGRKRALLIGIRKVKGYAKLKGAHDDVHKMSALLKDLYHYTPADITVLLDDKIDGHVKPTRTNILNAITDFVKDVKAGDRLFFHYSGHSTQVPNQSNSEEDGKDECLVPLDGEDNLIVDDELHAHLVVPLPAGAHLVAVLDTCHSGSLLDLKHYRCNRVFVPWVFPGNRNSEDKRQGVTRRGALFLQLSAFSKRSTLPPADTLSPANAFPTAPAWILPDDQRCDSPVARFPCDGWCGHHRTQDVDADDIKADVISLASCKDSQRAWEDVKDGVRITMTSALVEILRKDPNRSLKEVLVKIRCVVSRLCAFAAHSYPATRPTRWPWIATARERDTCGSARSTWRNTKNHSKRDS